MSNSASSLAGIFNVTLSTADKLSKAKIQLNHLSPFYAYLVEHLHFQETTMIPTMGVNELGSCFYSKEWVDKLPLPQLIGVLAHEISHLALRHHQRQNHRDIMVNGESLWNVAIDISDNYLLVENRFELPAEGIIPKNGEVEVFGYKVTDIGNKSSEEIYEELKAHLKNLVQQGKAQMVGQGSGSGQGQGQSQGQKGKKGNQGNQQGQGSGAGDDFENVKGSPKSFDEHLWGDKNPEKGEGKGDGQGNEKGNASKGNLAEGMGSQQKDWDKIMAEAYNHAKMIGKTPAGMARQFEDLHRGKVNWRAILRRTVASKIPYDLTYRRPNRKYLPHDIYMPSFVGESVKVIVSIDTSGSISSRELTEFMSEIISISKSFSQVEFRVLTHDVEVHDDLKVNSMNMQKLLKMTPHGGGGTSHKPLFNYIRAKRMKGREEMKLLISFTDGYSDYPDRKPDVDTVFVLCGAHVQKEQMPKWGTTICIE